MHEPRGLAAAASPVVELERKIHWRAHSLLIFIGMMIALTVVVAISALSPPLPIGGLPDDPDVRAASALVAGRVTVEAGELRFHAALLGGGAEGHRFAAADRALVSRAEVLLLRAAERHRDDPRLAAALACLDLVRRAPRSAERRYTEALDRAGHYGEARLGLGVALARRAEIEDHPGRQRALLLRAIAQMAAVRPGDPAHDAALFDRALLLDRVGRSREARDVARTYLERDVSSPWAERMRSLTGGSS